MKTLGYEDYNFDTSGRDDDDYCEETYEDDPNGCANDPLCESEYDDGEHECEEIEDDDDDDEEYCEQYEDNPRVAIILGVNGIPATTNATKTKAGRNSMETTEEAEVRQDPITIMMEKMTTLMTMTITTVMTIKKMIFLTTKTSMKTRMVTE